MEIAVHQDTFSAWIDTMPGSTHTFHVKGTCKTPSAGWTIKLVAAVPQGINPLVKLLEIEATPPDGPAADVLTTLEVTYEESPPQHEYTEVTIRYGKLSFTIPVKTVS